MSEALSLQFLAAYGSNPGKVRTLNEDACLAQFPVFLVADGMGGHEGGEVASQMALAAFQPLLGRFDVTVAEVQQCVETAQAQVSAFSDSLPSGAGTTLTGAVAVRQGQAWQWVVVNIGDSRTYRKLTPHFVQLTTDHSLVQEMVDAGELTQIEAATHPSRNVITKALGDGESEADLATTPISVGDRLIVVSDGALQDVPDATFATAASAASRKVAVQGIIVAALEAGGGDNITCVIVDVEGKAPKAPQSGFLPPTVALPALTPWPVPVPSAPPLPAAQPAPVDEQEQVESFEEADDDTAPTARKLVNP